MRSLWISNHLLMFLWNGSSGASASAAAVGATQGLGETAHWGDVKQSGMGRRFLDLVPWSSI